MQSFSILGCCVTIQNHEYVGFSGFFGTIIHIMRQPHSHRQTLTEFEKHGISYESLIEHCAHSLENDFDMLAELIYWNYGGRKNPPKSHLHRILVRFSKSGAGRATADQFVEKIRSCGNWGELYDELRLESPFQKEMYRRINAEVKCLKI